MGYTDKPPGCVGCPAYKSGVGFVPGTQPSDPQMILVGQGPGQQEAWNSKPFFNLAPIGERMNKWLYRSGWSRTRLMVGNLVQCWLPATRRNGVPDGNREPSAAEVRWCWNAHVGPWINTLGGGLVLVPVGVPATKFLMSIPKGKGAEKFMGTMNEVELPPVEENPSVER